MTVSEQIDAYIDGQPEPKQSDLRVLHQRMLQQFPDRTLWFLDGKNGEGKVVANPNIGYGTHAMRTADGKVREFYQVGLSANTTGISVYIMGIEDKSYLARTYGETLGKATVTGYCIKFRALKGIQLEVLEAVIAFGMRAARV